MSCPSMNCGVVSERYQPMVQIRAANGQAEGTCHAFIANVLTCADVPFGPPVSATGLGLSSRAAIYTQRNVLHFGG
jgi:hypothetical protein